MLVLTLFLLLPSFSFSSPVLSSSIGKLVGTWQENGTVAAFLGVPFAQFDRRFRYALPPTNTSSSHIVTSYSPACPQKCSNVPKALCPVHTSETDCLTLNLFVPASAVHRTPSSAPSPLLDTMIFIAGGGYKFEASSSCLYSGAPLVLAEHRAVISFNYRTGVLGFAAGSAVDDNVGLDDQRQAIAFIRQNAQAWSLNTSAFTLFGQSAGAASLAASLASTDPMPAHAVILESVPWGLKFSTKEEATETTNRAMAAGNCSSIECLQALPVDVMVEVGASIKHVEPFPPWRLHSQNALAWQPFLTPSLPDQPVVALSRAMARAPGSPSQPLLVLGSNTDDGLWFVRDAVHRTLNTEEALAFLALIFNTSVATQLLDLYKPLIDEPVSASYDWRLSLERMVTHYIFACPARAVARARGGFLYRFDQLDEAGAKAFFGSTKSYCYDAVCHGMELPFVFGTQDVCNLPGSPSLDALSRQMMHTWASTTASDTPVLNASLAWLPASPATGSNLRFADDSSGGIAMENAYASLCDYWDTIGYGVY
uniref:Carboxylesterase type B domain-containing protein n=1 Tax=Sexangularia sp. CB-2014 TaxID=1486929 RepID=A0A7S1VC45_9EUKA|mmetsp:Transcript_15962/g.49859  ORF Transcript_15962/g.49859 Transcript_15962/m.49859 type:complete len:539 (+) Transcript_15962:122-1738(+)|eukprot:CAMPEP_0170753886 /NCGR_PEP_ID=MMETSP0437-20130122/12721_1 /TAXON_ID=0 /ORGANISM="Sexangularia sp." /LENGTH=538 /DNA_ID=CAMNT_0011093013 /DNA_START=45 /DNA_END=1661 /DNA_ORIENTATION=+